MTRTLRSHCRMAAAVALVGLLGAACSRTPSISSISVAPTTGTLSLGHTLQLSVTASVDDGSTQAVNDAVWSSSDSSVAAVSGAGLVTAKKVGTATVTVASSGFTATAAITVTPYPLVALASSPASVTLVAGATATLAITGTYENGATSTVNTGLTFTSSNLAAATVSAAGVVTGVAKGTSTVFVASGSVSTTVPVTVTPSLSSIAVSPASSTLFLAGTQRFVVIGTWSDSTTTTLSAASSTFTSLSPAVATTTASGLVTAVGYGAATIQAAVGTLLATAQVTVVPSLLSIAVSLPSATLPINTTSTLTVTASWSNGTTTDVTTSASVSSSQPSVLTVSGRVVTAVGYGTATLGASYSGKTGSLLVTVPVTLDHILAQPAAAGLPLSPTIRLGDTLQLAVVAFLSDGSQQTVSASSTFTAQETDLAQVTSPGGLVSALGAGTAHVLASYGGKSSTVTVTVLGLSSLALTGTLSTNWPAPRDLGAVGTWADSSTSTLTQLAVFDSSDHGVAVMSTSTNGRVLPVSPGTTTITASLFGRSVTSTFTVSNDPLVSIDVAPSSVPHLAVDGFQQLLVTGHYANSPSQDLTGAAAFASSATSVATVSAAGLVSAVAPGPTTITVSVPGTVAAPVQVLVNVDAPVLQLLTVTPSSTFLYVGASAQLAVVGSYDHGPSSTLTTVAGYTSSSTAVAIVSSSGNILAKGPGHTTVHATYGGRSANVEVYVTGLTALAVAPASFPLLVGGQQQLAVVGTWTDSAGAHQTSSLTGIAAFGSSSSSVATVGAGTGLVTAVAPGSAVLTATVTTSTIAAGSLSATSTVTVAAPVSNPGLVFVDGYASGVVYSPFGGSTGAPVLDTSVTLTSNGHSSLRFDNPTSNYIGGSFIDMSGGRDLSAYNAVTFWAKSSSPTLSLPVYGFGDSNGVSNNLYGGYKTEGANLPLTSTWQKYVLPLPNGARLTSMNALFHIADGLNHSTLGSPISIWLADIQYETVGGIGAPTITWTTTARTVADGVGYTVAGGDLHVDFTVNSNPVALAPVGPNFFTFTSDNTAVATVSGGVVTGLNSGTSNLTANIKASLQSATSGNALVLTVTGAAPPVPAPLVPAPTPTAAVASSLYSSNVPGGYNGTANDVGLSAAQFDEFSDYASATTTTIASGGTTGTPLKFVFTQSPAHNHIGWGFHATTGQEIDAVANNYDKLHMDVWSPDIATPVGSVLVVGLIDFGADQNTHTQGNLTLIGANHDYANSTSTGPHGGWITYDFPLSAFITAGLTPSPHHLSQFVITVPQGATFYLDNVYLYNSSGAGGGATGPSSAAASPTAASNGVVNLYTSSGVYVNPAFSDWSVAVTQTWSPNAVPVNDDTTSVSGRTLKKFVLASSANFTGSQLAAPVTITGKKTLHVSVFTPNGGPLLPVQVGLAGGAFLSAPAGGTLIQNSWSDLTYDFSAFSGATMDQLLFVNPGSPGTYWVDNIYFDAASSSPVGVTSPGTLPPVPSRAPGATVYSLYSSVTGGYNGTVSDKRSKVDTFLAAGGGTGGTSTAPLVVGASSTSPLKYVLTPGAGSNGTIEFLGANEIDAVALGLTTLHIDFWTPDQGTNFQVKLIDFGANGVNDNGGGDDTAGIMTFTSGSSPALGTGHWISADLPLASAFGGLQNLRHLAQLALFGPLGGTFYVDNLYFWGGGPATVPNSAAPTPTLPAAYVKSLLNSGGTYVDYNASGTPAGLGNWNPNWGQGGSISDTVVGGRTIKLMNLVNYQGVDISGPNGDPGETHPGPIDATGMSFLHISYWTANGTTLSVDLINNAAETFTMPSASSSQVTFAVTQGAWAELNIPLPAGFTDLTTIRQIKFTNQTDAIHNGAFGPAGVFYLDNLYFWTPPPTAPTTAAPSPGLPSGSVQSLYNSSATYVDYNSGAGGLGNWNPNWGQGGSISDVVVGGKTVKLMNLVNYQGVDISGPNGDPGESAPAAINISGKTSLHISYWTANGTALAVDIISHVSESWATATVGQRSFTVTQFAWVDLEVPIPAGMTDLTQIRQLKFATEANAGTGSGGGGVFYLDNLYFH